ncbi:MAG TPA: hypothetical protein VNM90_21585 [Haliangium sp.]|nr:hypothetical protein [Haliangium sp.]
MAELDALLQQVEQARAERDWDKALDLLKKAYALEGLDEQRIAPVKEMALRMDAEKKSKAAFESLRTAIEKQRFDDMFEALGKIPEDSVYRAEAREAALEAVRTRAQRLLRRGDCKALASLVTKAVSVFPEAKDELEDQKATCVQAPVPDEQPPSSSSSSSSSSKRDPTQLLDAVRKAYNSNLFLSASRNCKELRNLGRVNDEAAMLCGYTACKFKDAQTAKWYQSRPSNSQIRKLIAERCLKEGIDLKK